MFDDLPKNIAVAIEEYCGVDLSQEEYVTEKGGVNVCKAINDMKKKSIEQGIEQNQKQITINLLKLNLPKEQIVFATGLSLEEISELEQTI